ncbi:MAG: thioredoxin domain-containing protein [Labilithrix sp.]|nr:thioredoxin domain-containing protein [Labilithrix sp.]MBX3224372.1 thioredoxin domain-containing protein [Labilithrix sp.]
MRKNLWFWLTVVLAAAALVASAILLVDYVRPAPVFCDAGGGCGKVKETVFARPFGVPLPAIGLIGVLGIGLAALVPGRVARIAQAALAVVGGAVALFLFGIQAKMGALCPFCAVVDGASIGLAAIAILRWRKAWDPPRGRLVPTASAVGLVASIGVPFAVGFQLRAIPGDVPAVIAEEMRASGRGKVTVVDFVDFECPFCRMTHAELTPLLEPRKDKVRVARKHVPLRMHPHAMDAAKAACCGEALGKGDAMADALFHAPPNELTPEGCERLAVQQGLALEKFRACVKDPATEARIEKDKETFRAVKGHGLPTIWVDGTKLEGAQDRETLAATLDEAIRAL